MRLSPVVMASVALVATLSYSHSASAQTLSKSLKLETKKEAKRSLKTTAQASARQSTSPQKTAIGSQKTAGSRLVIRDLTRQQKPLAPARSAPPMQQIMAEMLPIGPMQMADLRTTNPQTTSPQTTSPQTTNPQTVNGTGHNGGAGHNDVKQPQAIKESGKTAASKMLAQNPDQPPQPVTQAIPIPLSPQPATPPSLPSSPNLPGTIPSGVPAPQNPASPTPPSLSPGSPPPGVPQTPIPGTAPATPTLPGGTPGTLPGAPQPQPAPADPTEARVLISEVLIKGAEGELRDEIYRVIRTQPGRTTTRSQIQEDISAVFATGFFSNVKATPEDTPLGVRIAFEVQVNPVLRSVQLEGGKIVPAKVVQDAFSPQYGKTLNLRDLQQGIQQVNKWYQDNGYVLAQVVLDAPKISPDGTVTLQVAEGVVENLQVRFIDKQGNDKDAKGNPIKGRTRDFVVTREFELKPGQVFNRSIAERDLQRAFGLGIFDDIRLALQPGQDPRQVVVVVNVVERNTGNIGLAGGFSSASGLFGSVSFGQQNVGGNNQKLNSEVQIGQRDQQVDLSFTDPWIAGDPFRTSYTLRLFRNRTIPTVFDGGDRDVRLGNADQDRPRINRTGGGISFSRPLSKNIFERSEWTASLGMQYRRATVTDGDNIKRARDQFGNRLTFSGTPSDDLLTGIFSLRRDRRDDGIRPTRGSVLDLSTEQSVPVGTGSILLNRLKAGYSFFIPTRLTKFTPGCRNQAPRPGEQPAKGDCPQAFAFNLQGGTVLGDLPPYEAFPLGGTNSIRGYDEGDVGSGRSFLQATAEYRFPLFSIISGALFADAGTDLGSGSSVPGDPGGARNKPGRGLGYGVGVRVQSPLGPIRIDWGFNDRGGNNIRFGFGERF